MTRSYFVKIQQSFCALPARHMSHNEISQHVPLKMDDTLETRSSTITKHTGIKQRRYALPHECSSDLAYKALAPALVDFSEDELKNITTLIVTTTSPDFPSPATATFVHKKSRLPKHIHCFDVASSCSSFLSGLRASFGSIEENKLVFVIASEVKHKNLDPTDIRTLSLFADGSAGCTLTANNKCHMKIFSCNTFSEYSENIIIPAGGSKTPTTENNIQDTKLKLFEPKKMFLVTVKYITEMIIKSLEFINTKSQVLFFIHQANKNILKEVMNQIPLFAKERVAILMSDIGNTVCSSLPILRTRVLFLRALFYEMKEPLTTKNIVHFFKQVTLKNSDFKYFPFRSGFVFQTSLQGEVIKIFDDGCTTIETSWFAHLDDEELNHLNTIFSKELENSFSSYTDVLIAAGGGFQTLGFVYHY